MYKCSLALSVMIVFYRCRRLTWEICRLSSDSTVSIFASAPHSHIDFCICCKKKSMCECGTKMRVRHIQMLIGIVYHDSCSSLSLSDMTILSLVVSFYRFHHCFCSTFARWLLHFCKKSMCECGTKVRVFTCTNADWHRPSWSCFIAVVVWHDNFVVCRLIP